MGNCPNLKSCAVGISLRNQCRMGSALIPPAACHSEHLQRPWPLSVMFQKQHDFFMLFLESEAKNLSVRYEIKTKRDSSLRSERHTTTERA
jgi:hypothetical protein